MTHEHLHLFADGLRRLVHDHDRADQEATGLRAHAHANGRHAHHHGHDGYEPLPKGEVRRPIIPAETA